MSEEISNEDINHVKNLADEFLLAFQKYLQEHDFKNISEIVSAAIACTVIELGTIDSNIPKCIGDMFKPEAIEEINAELNRKMN